MPRIPESAVTRGLTPVSRQPIREALAIGQAVTGLTDASAQLASRFAEAERAKAALKVGGLLPIV